MKLESRLVAYGVCAGLVLSWGAALAQEAGQSCSDMQMIQNKCGQTQKPKKEKQEKQAAPSTQYPDATRQEPKI